MTSNLPLDVIRAQLDQMNKKDEKAIQITYSIGLSAQFLDVHVENCHGSLVTTVFHKPAAEPYLLPFSSDHPRHIHINILYEALLRAARYCSYVDVFDRERLHIEMILPEQTKIFKNAFKRTIWNHDCEPNTLTNKTPRTPFLAWN